MSKDFPSPRRWGLGFEVGGDLDNPYVRHEGSAFFQDDMVEYLRGDGIVVMTSGGDGGTLAEEVLRSAAAVYGFPDFRSVERALVAVPISTLRDYIGTFGFIKVAMEGDHLTAEIPSGSRPKRLYPESPTHFFVLDAPQELSFVINSQQDVSGVEFITSMSHRRLNKNPAP